MTDLKKEFLNRIEREVRKSLSEAKQAFIDEHWGYSVLAMESEREDYYIDWMLEKNLEVICEVKGLIHLMITEIRENND